jgi:hypothetical protein
MKNNPAEPPPHEECHDGKRHRLWLDTQDMLQLLKIKPRTLRHYRKMEWIPYHRVGGRGKILFDKDEVEKALIEGMIGKKKDE